MSTPRAALPQITPERIAFIRSVGEGGPEIDDDGFEPILDAIPDEVIAEALRRGDQWQAMVSRCAAGQCGCDADIGATCLERHVHDDLVEFIDSHDLIATCLDPRGGRDQETGL